MPTADKDEQRLDDAARRLREASSQFTGRRREVFDRLLGFETEKEIALSLGLSKHTIHGYAKIIYALCSVHTRKELRLTYAFVQRSGGGPAAAIADSV